MPKREPVKGKVRLLLEIEVQTRKGSVTTAYTVRFLESHPEIGAPAWRLTKTDGEFYDIILKPSGPECSCADFTFCRINNDARGCKHICACRAVGLLQVSKIGQVTT